MHFSGYFAYPPFALPCTEQLSQDFPSELGHVSGYCLLGWCPRASAARPELE